MGQSSLTAFHAYVSCLVFLLFDQFVLLKTPSPQREFEILVINQLNAQILVL